MQPKHSHGQATSRCVVPKGVEHMLRVVGSASTGLRESRVIGAPSTPSRPGHVGAVGRRLLTSQNFATSTARHFLADAYYYCDRSHPAWHSPTRMRRFMSADTTILPLPRGLGLASGRLFRLLERHLASRGTCGAALFNASMRLFVRCRSLIRRKTCSANAPA